MLVSYDYFYFFIAGLCTFLCQSSPIMLVFMLCGAIYQPREIMVVLPGEDCPV